MLLMIALAAALFARHWMIEPADIGHLCDSGQGPWWCGLRLAIIMSFARGWLGWFVLSAGVAATVLRWRWLAAAAAVAGVLAVRNAVRADKNATEAKKNAAEAKKKADESYATLLVAVAQRVAAERRDVDAATTARPRMSHGTRRPRRTTTSGHPRTRRSSRGSSG